MQLREREAGIEGVMGPVEDMYALLMRYEVRVPKDETDLVSDMRYSWKKLRRMASDVSDNLARLQVRASHTFIIDAHLYCDAICFQRYISQSAVHHPCPGLLGVGQALLKGPSMGIETTGRLSAYEHLCELSKPPK